MPREFARHQRLGSELLRTLNELIRGEAKDPRLEGVTVTELELSGDLSQAKAYVSLLRPDDDPAPVIQALERASGFLRSRLGKIHRIRKVPALVFLHDDSASRGAALAALIRDAAPPPNPDEGDSSESE